MPVVNQSTAADQCHSFALREFGINRNEDRAKLFMGLHASACQSQVVFIVGKSFGRMNPISVKISNARKAKAVA